MARPNITVRITGLNETSRNLSGMSRDIVQVLAGTINQEHEAIMTIAKERTPVLTGALRASGHVIPPVILRRSIKSVGAFGGPSAAYAVIVHEDLNAHHNVGQAKFYESAVRERRRNVKAAVKEAVSEFLESRARR